MSPLDDDLAGWTLRIAIAAVLCTTFVVLYGIPAWKECRRVHPAWYCAVSR